MSSVGARGGGRPGPEGQTAALAHGFRKPKDTAKTAKRLLDYISSSKWLLILAAVMVIINAVASIYGAYFLTPLVNEFLLPYIGTDPDFVILRPLLNGIIFLAVLYFVGTAASYVQNRVMLYVSQKTLYSLRKDLFEAVERLPMSYFDSKGKGELMSRFTTDIDAIKRVTADGLMQFFSSGITLSLTLIMMLITNFSLTVIMAVLIALMLFIAKKVSSVASRGFRAQQASLAAVNSHLEERLSAGSLLRLYDMSEKDRQQFAAINDELCKNACAANTGGTIMLPVMGNLSYMNYIIIAALGALSVMSGRMDLGSFASYLYYTRSFANPVTHISQQWSSLLAALAGAERIFEVLDEPAEIDDGKVITVVYNDRLCWAVPDMNYSCNYIPVQGNIRFENVCFAYDKGDIVLQDFSLDIPSGSKIALIGATGAGKSTVIKLICRFYELQSGNIYIDGINICDIKKSALRGVMAIVLQDVHLFGTTVEKNIRYGNRDASDAEILQAAELANADYFINMLPEGMATSLSADGESLSRGQRQLISIAQAACRKPHILIFDEATAFVDTRTEKLIERGMDELMKDKTVLIIAHRLSTVRNADMIIVMEKGCIVEKGDHSSLMQLQGRYYEFYTHNDDMDENLS